MEKEIRKVKITMDGIKKDVLDKNFIWETALFIILLTPLVLCNIALFQKSELKHIIFGLILFVLFVFPLIMICVLIIYYHIYKSIALNKGNITIKKILL